MIRNPIPSLVAVLAFSLVSSASAELLFSEDFDFPVGIEILGNENEWQADFNDEGPSMAGLRPRHTQECSPFPAQGLALQPTNSKQRSHRKIGDYTGQRIFFSYSTKVFTPSGQSALRFRSDAGVPVWVGQIDGKFAVQIGNWVTNTGMEIEARRAYFVAGEFQTSADGRMISVSANAYTALADIPAEAPTEWQVSATHTLGQSKLWNGVEFLAASSNAAFDALRIGTTWADVTKPE